MKPARRILPVAFLLAVLGAFAWFLFRAPGPPDPVYNGKPLSFWINRMNVWKDEKMSPIAVVISFGTTNEVLAIPTQLDSNAAPFLVRELQKHDPPFHHLYMKFFEKSPHWLQERLPWSLDAGMIRANAAIMLARTGPATPETIQALISAAKSDEDVRGEAIESLGQIGGTNLLVSQALISFLNDTNLGVRRIATNVLRRVNPAALPVPNRHPK